jgi:hypothetical protein
MQCPFCKHYFDEEVALDVQDKINWLLWQESMRQVKTKLRFWQNPGSCIGFWELFSCCSLPFGFCYTYKALDPIEYEGRKIVLRLSC